MGTGIVLTYLLIVALLAPVGWLMWWAVAAVGSARLSNALAPSPRVRATRLNSPIPQPADVTLPRHPKAITFYRLSDCAEIGGCKGPDGGGKCPRAYAGGTVPCAGSVLSLPRPIRGSAEWHIPTGYDTCLVGGYEVFRQPVSAT